MRRLIVDVSSLCWMGLYAGTDEEFSTKVEHNGKLVTVNGWKHGWENVINSLLSAWEKNGIAPKDTILVYESGNSAGLRRRWLPTYKQGRDDSRPQEYYTEFNKLKQELITVIKSLGGCAITRPNLEADDVICYLSQKLGGYKLIMTNDADLGACIKDDVHMWRQNELITENPIGPWPVQWIPVYKALVGDTSDKIPGAKGFGPKKWLDLICIFGDDGVELMEQLITHKQLNKLEEDVGEFKALQKIIDNADDVYRSYAAGKLYPEMCENMRVPLQWEPGYVKPRSQITDDRLRRFGGVDRIVHADNFDTALQFLREKLAESDFVSLDLETYTSDESDEWLEGVGGGVDVLDSKIVSMGLTFGDNQQYNFYYTVQHKDDGQTPNLTLAQLKQVVEAIPVEMRKVIANFSGFEAVVLRNELGGLSGHYFLPNAVDVQLEAVYVNENLRRGLKFLTKHYLGVDQLDYETVTQGRKMNQLTAAETLEYGTGDTLFTSALHTFFRIIMEIEGTVDGFEKTELDVQYVLAHSFLHGINFDFERLLEIEKEDLEEEAKAQEILDNYLIKIGYEGTVCPVYTEQDLQVPATIKDIYNRITGQELKTQVRTPEKLYKLIAAQEEVDDAPLLAKFLTDGNLDQINDWVASRFDGKPQLDLGSPKQVKNFMYRVCRLPVNLINPLTDNERKNKPELAQAVWSFNKLQKKPDEAEPLTEEQQTLLIDKATTDQYAIEFALKYDVGDDDELRQAIEAFAKLKEINTRKSLFYNVWKPLVYWKDRKMHPSIRQSDTTSLRFTASKPNVTQLGKGGDGLKLRSCFTAHKKGAVVVSLDFNAQELRAQADLSGDEAFIACYIGDDKKDLHSLTGASIEGISYEQFRAYLHDDDPDIQKKYKDIRSKISKPVNFLSAYSGTEVALHKKMTIRQHEAKVFLDAKKAAFPRYEEYQEEVKDFAKAHGYVDSIGGSRRHLADKVLSDDKWEVEAAARSGGNYPIQGGCAAQTKRAMGAIWRSGILEKYDVRFYMPVHDEIVFSVAAEHAIPVCKVVYECMTQPFLPRIPSASSISIGLNYADQPEVCEEGFDEQAIRARLDELFPIEQTV